MSNRNAVTLTKEQIAVINNTVSRGDRVEIIPTKEGARIVKILRRNVKSDSVGLNAQTTTSDGDSPQSAKAGQDGNPKRSSGGKGKRKTTQA